MITFQLNGRLVSSRAAQISVGHYPKMNPGEPDQVGWRITERGELLGVPTVNLAEYGLFPKPGHVFIKITREYDGYLQSLVDAGLTRETGRIVPAGFVERYAAECEVLRPELLGVEG